MKRALVSSIVFGGVTCALLAFAQKPAPPPPSRTPPAASTPTNLRAHVGGDSATRLLHSSDPEERIRGIQRAAGLASPETVALLVDVVATTRNKNDTRELLELARALAPFADNERARGALLTIVNIPNPNATGRGSNADEGDSVARAELAREVAAIALAHTGGERALEALYGVARGGGIGQTAALFALGVHPPRDPGFFGTPGSPLPVAVARILGELGDLRALDVLHGAVRSSDIAVRSAALVSLAELGDERAIPLARTAIAEGDVRLRAAAGEVFIMLGAPERFKATTALITDEATTALGLRMAERVFNPEITKLVAARAALGSERPAAIRALGRSPDPDAATMLVSSPILGDRSLAYLALSALARSPAPNANALVASLFAKQPTLAGRAYVVRALVRGERSSEGNDALARLTRSNVSLERAVGVFGRVALGNDDAEGFLEDKDPHVRRAAIAASAARPPSARRERAFLHRLAKDEDPISRQLLAAALASGDPEGLVKTSTLSERSESGGGDAPLAAFAYARRADEKSATKIDQLLDSKDAVLRAHVARGLGVAPLADASGLLARAYAWETEPDVRRALISALAARIADADAPARKRTLALAAELDPDGPVRLAARRAIAGIANPLGSAAVHEIAWLRVTLDSGAAPGEPYVGSFVRSDGLAVPIAFDEEGYALIPGLPPGEGRLMLAPRLPKSEK